MGGQSPGLATSNETGCRKGAGIPRASLPMGPAPSPGLEFLGAERVGDVLDGVTETVRVVVGGVDAPAGHRQWAPPSAPTL